MRIARTAPEARPITWLPAKPVDRADQWGPKTYHVAGWLRWSDRRKLKALRELAEQYGRDPKLREFVIANVISGVPDRDFPGQARAMLAWVQSNVRYVNETNEQLQTPDYTLKVRFGDCDDMAVLLAAMATSIAVPWRFVVAGRTPQGKPVRWAENEPQRFRGAQYYHIYLDLGVSGPQFRKNQGITWVPAEPTLKGAPLGYDVTIHGVPGQMGELQSSTPTSEVLSGAWGMPMVDKPYSGGRYAMPEPVFVLSGYGAPPASYTRSRMRTAMATQAALTATQTPSSSASSADSGTSGYDDRSFVRRQLEDFPWTELVLGVVQGVVSAVLIERILSRKGY